VYPAFQLDGAAVRERTRHPVRIADAKRGDGARAGRGPRGAVADGIAGIDAARGHDACTQRRDRIGRHAGRTAVEEDAGTHEVGGEAGAGERRRAVGGVHELGARGQRGHHHLEALPLHVARSRLLVGRMKVRADAFARGAGTQHRADRVEARGVVPAHAGAAHAAVDLEMERLAKIATMRFIVQGDEPNRQWPC